MLSVNLIEYKREKLKRHKLQTCTSGGETESQLENGIDIWTAKNGNVEFLFIDFLNQVKDFFEKFFEQMNKQVELALEKEWKDIQIDKEELIEEHKERKEKFDSQLKLLEHKSRSETDWNLVTNLYNRMKKEI